MDMWCEDCKEYDMEHHNCPRFNHVIRTALEDAGMVSVVRCKECNAYMTDGYADGCGFCAYHHSVVRADDFCSYGERREP